MSDSGKAHHSGKNKYHSKSKQSHHSYQTQGQAKKFKNPHAKHENITRKLMVHQTSPECAAAILSSQQFLPSQRWDQVGSIYFAENAPETENKAQKKGTYLMADVYLGVNTGNDTDFQSTADNITAIRNEKGKYNEGLEYVIKDPNRARNIRYLDGIKPPGIIIEMRDRMPLIYATTKEKAAEILKNQIIPIENRPDMAGWGYYLWENIPDARKYSMSGTETYLAADVHFPYCFEENRFPNHYEYKNFSSFRGDFQDTHYYMVRFKYTIVNIRYISGVRPPETTA